MPKRGKKCRTSNNLKVILADRRSDKCDNVSIGAQNIIKWNTLKIKLGCKTDEEFATYLLDLAIKEKGNQIYNFDKDSQGNEESPTNYDSDSESLHKNIISVENVTSPARTGFNESVTTSIIKVEKEIDTQDESFFSYTEKKIKPKKWSVIVANEGNLEFANNSSIKHCTSSQDCEFNNQDLNTKDFCENSKLSSICDSPLSNTNERVQLSESNKIIRVIESDNRSVKKHENSGNGKVKHVKKLKTSSGDNVKHLEGEKLIKHRKRKHKRNLNKKRNGFETPTFGTTKFDDSFEEETETNKTECNKTESENDKSDKNKEDEISKSASSPRVAITIKLCSDCDLRHVQNACPLYKPVRVISDAVKINQCQWLNNWNKDKSTFPDQSVHKDNENESVELEIQPSFAVITLPEQFELREIDSVHGLSVITKEFLPPYVEFGPLIGQPIKEMEIPDDFLMKDIWEICTSSKCTYLSTQDPEHSNWLRWIRPAPIRSMRNIAVICRNGELIFVTVTSIEPGEELLFWAENTNTAWSNKNLCKISCGGCNLRFSHTLYYRLHCAVFHDPNYSLTIRKYHCKVCGLSVLGKEHIMKHAADFHDGRGAYQCQFCKKFFLRLNYLEMHRTYGCSANPHRARPLCDYCGRKFSQPQKLKVHIKRMHSDMSEVLKEFQCKRCLKLLGSRAALQRHNKEVHCKDIVRACTCDRCGKMFQNKSNLKIHMLTHSGIKPFRCAEQSCGAAFTTKQCLQLHYKKVHGFDKTKMPVIERSVAYTFDAYAGGSRPNSVNSCCSRYSSEEDEMDQAMPSSPQRLEEVSATPDQSASMEVYNKMVISKGSKKWMGNDTIEHNGGKVDDVFEFDEDEPKSNDEILNKNEPVSMLFHHCKPESSNASLLVEAALDAAERDIDINSGPVKLPSPQPLIIPNKITDSLYPTFRSHLAQSPTPQVLSRSISPSEYPIQDHNHSPHLIVDSGYPPSISPRHSSYNLILPDRTPHYEVRFSPSAGQMESFHLDESRYDLHHRRMEENSSDESSNVAQNLSLGLKGKSLQLDLSAAYKYEALDERGTFEPLEGLDMSRSGNYHHSSFVSMPPRYPHTLYEQRPYSHTDVLRVVNLTHSVDLSLPRNLHHQLIQPTNQNLMDPLRVISPPPTYQSFPLSPSSYLAVPRSTHSPTYHHYSGY